MCVSRYLINYWLLIATPIAFHFTLWLFCLVTYFILDRCNGLTFGLAAKITEDRDRGLMQDVDLCGRYAFLYFYYITYTHDKIILNSYPFIMSCAILYLGLFINLFRALTTVFYPN